MGSRTPVCSAHSQFTKIYRRLWSAWPGGRLFPEFFRAVGDLQVAGISRFGLDSGVALATVVGVLIEVPVMLSVVRIVGRTKTWYLAGSRD